MNRVSKKQAVLLCLLCSFFLIFILFRHSLLCHGVELFLKKKFLEGEEVLFDYESSDWKGASCTLRQVRLSSKGDRSQKFDAKIETLSLKVSIQFSPFLLKSEILIEAPELSLFTSEKRDKDRLSLAPYDFLLKRNILIRRGKLSFGSNQPNEIHFALQPKLGSLNQKEMLIGMSRKELKNPPIRASLSKRERGLAIDINLDQLDLPWVVEALRYLEEVDPAICLKQGTLSGKLACELGSKKQISHLDYDLQLSNFYLAHEKYGTAIFLNRAESKRGRALRGYRLNDQIWKCFVGKGQFSGAKITFKNPEMGSDQLSAKLAGEFELKESGQLFAHFNGISLGRDKRFFHLSSHGQFGKTSDWKLHIDSSLQQEGKRQMKAHIDIKANGMRSHLFDIAFQEIESDSIKWIEHLTEMNHPQIALFKLEKGILSGAFEGKLEQGRLISAHLKDLKIIQASFKDAQHRLCFSADQMQTNGVFDLLKKPSFEKQSWELTIDNGSFEGVRGAKIGQINGHLFMQNSRIRPSQMRGSINGIETTFHLEGTQENLQLRLGLGFTPQEIFPQLKEGGMDQIRERLLFDVDMHLQLLENLEIGGSLKIRRVDHTQSVIDFKGVWKADQWMKGNFLEGMEFGWLKSDLLSSDLINCSLLLLGREWSVAGHVALEGVFSKNVLSLSFDPSHLRFSCPYIDLEGNPESQDEPCRLHFDFGEKSWKGDFPVKKSRLWEHSFGIPFESFTSQVELEDRIFHFRNIRGITQGVLFEGEIRLDYQNPERAEILFSTDHIEGSTKAVQTLLRHFKPFKKITLPLKGEWESGRQGMYLKAYLGEKKELIDWNVNMKLKNGTYPITPSCSFKDLEAKCEWCWETQKLNVTESRGYLSLKEASSKKYHLNIPLAQIDFKQGCWVYDIRLETKTHDICRLVGRADQTPEEEKMQVQLDPELTHFFGAKIDARTFLLDEQKRIDSIELETDLSARDLYHHLDFFDHAGFLPVQIADLKRAQTPQFEGAAHIKLLFNRALEHLDLEIKSDRFVFGKIDTDAVLLHLKKEKSKIGLCSFSSGSLKMSGEMERKEDFWSIPFFTVDWNKCKMRGEDGFLSKGRGKVELPLKHLEIDLDWLLEHFPSLNGTHRTYFGGSLSALGTLECDFSEGIEKAHLNANLNLTGKGIGKAQLDLESRKPIRFDLFLGKGIEIEEAAFEFFDPSADRLWGKCHVGLLSYEHRRKKWEGKKVHLVLPPEMLHHLASKRALPYFGEREGSLTLFEHPLRWDNQTELTFDFTWGEKLSLSGSLKEGYYWIRNKSCYLHHCQYLLNDGKIDLELHTAFEERPFKIQARAALLPHFKASVTIKDRETCDLSKSPLSIVGSYQESKGFFIQSVEGSINGLDVSLHHDPRKSCLDRMALTGQLKMDLPKIAPYLPSFMQKMVEKCEVGKGYELSGDLILSKDHLSNSYFTGYLKGKRFELLGSQMETLMSEIRADINRIELKNLTLSDVSGIFAIETIELSREKNRPWKVVIPTITVQDFRPSLLKKIGSYERQIKPLTIRHLSFQNLQGVLGDPKSFKGEGTLTFTNTFKNDYNILDLPFELLANLGLDTGLLVPIRGRLDYFLEGGRIYLKELLDSHSEGKRSKFYLSPVEASYIDLDGNLNIKIKMKQDVLLKVTQPFTLSIGGTFKKIRYSLE